MGRCPRKTLQKVNGSLFAFDVCKVDGCIGRWIICNDAKGEWLIVRF